MPSPGGHEPGCYLEAEIRRGMMIHDAEQLQAGGPAIRGGRAEKLKSAADSALALTPSNVMVSPVPQLITAIPAGVDDGQVGETVDPGNAVDGDHFFPGEVGDVIHGPIRHRR